MANFACRKPYLSVLVFAAVAFGCSRAEPQLAWEREPTVADPSTLTRIIIVPTLDTPVPVGKSAIWCSSFQLAWNRLKTDLAKGPVQLKNAQMIADRLNRASASESDLDPSMFYAAAGFLEDGIVETIRRNMAEKFPGVPTPSLDKYPSAPAYAYAYLRAGVKYRFPYFDNTQDFAFTDSSGATTTVHSFGIPVQGRRRRIRHFSRTSRNPVRPETLTPDDA